MKTNAFASLFQPKKQVYNYLKKGSLEKGQQTCCVLVSQANIPSLDVPDR